MAVGSAVIAVDSSDQFELMAGLKRGFIQNLGPNVVYLGGASVTPSDGFELFVSTDAVTLPIGLAALEKLYGICATSQTASVRVLTYTG